MVDGRPLQTYSRFRGIGRYVESIKRAFNGEEFIRFLYFKDKFLDDGAIYINSPRRFTTVLDEYYLYGFLRKEKPYVFHSTGYMIPRRINGIFYTATVYDLTQVKFRKHSKIRNRFVFKRILKTYEKRADIVVTISNSTKEDLIELTKIGKDRIRVVYPYVEMPEIPDNFSPDLNIPKEYIFYCGGFDSIKNVELLIGIVEFIDLPIVLSGKIDEKKVSYYLSLISEKNRKKVYFTGFVDDMTLGWLYKNSLLFVYPSIYEGFGYPPLEAIYYGVKTLVANIPVLRETLNGMAHFFDLKTISSKGLAEAVEELLSCEGGVKIREEFYMPERFRKQMLSIWKNL